MRAANLMIFFTILISTTAWSKDIVVSPEDTSGIDEAKAGDTVWLEEGRYDQPIYVEGLQGTPEQPIIFSPRPGARVVLDGTDALGGTWTLVTPESPEGARIQPAQWKRIGGNKLYAMRLKGDIHALTYNGRLMSDARWPDARWGDPWRLDRYMVLRKAGEGSQPGVIYDSLTTENTLEESSKWLRYDRSPLTHREESLADTELDFTGATALLSCFWTSFGTRVTGHGAGQDHFNFDTKFNGSGGIQKQAIRFVIDRVEWDNSAPFRKSTHGSVHFFLMGLAALDIPEEWFYHRPSKTLYFIPPHGTPPAPGKTCGKRRDHLVTIKNSAYVHFKGMEFLGASAFLLDCENSRIEDCNFTFSSYNKFALGNFDMPVTTRIENRKGGREQYGNALVNCQFKYLDGNAFKGASPGLTAYNILIYQTQMTTLGDDSRSASFDNPLLVRRVTLSDVGASVGIKGGGIDSVYELNNLQRFGGLQYDGASLQMGGKEQKLYRFNWSHDHPKFSYRFDTAKYGTESHHGEMSFNIAWNTPGGYMLKGDKHLFQNNVLLGDGAAYLFNLPEWASSNRSTLAVNNAVPALLADRGKGEAEMLAILVNNTTGNITQYFRDPINLDFRPKSDSPLIDAATAVKPIDVPWKATPITEHPEIVGEGPDIGAYEAGASQYWIPGFKFPHASSPIPPNETTTAKSDCSLMWLGGYKADVHHLYVGTTASAVEHAGKKDSAYQGRFEDGRNVFDFKEPLPLGTVRFWRVDADRDGSVTKGNVWKFTVEN